MAETTIKPSFASGELSPGLWGRPDMEKFHTGASVARNMFVNYRGGMSSRPGTALVGICKQAGSALPPKLIRFQFSIGQNYMLEFGDRYMRVISNGGYVTNTAINITGITRANPGVVTSAAHGLNTGDWVYITGVVGMTQVNGQTFAVTTLSANTFSLGDLILGPTNTLGYSAYVSGGQAASLFTLSTPYNAVDLNYLKFTQSADTMSICCVNQVTGSDYPPQDLKRFAANSWTITVPTFAASNLPPTSVNAAAQQAWSGSLPGPVAYGYVVTAIDSNTGQESIASGIAVALNSVDISRTFGTVRVSWNASANAGNYNIYKCAPDFTGNGGSFTGQIFGFVGSTTSAAGSWEDTNIFPNFTITPPLHTNPYQSSGNYPSVVEYFQQRRVYASTFNLPDTYQMSQTGAYTNFDAANPPIAADAITGTPWGREVNGIQWMVPMTGGLIVATGLDAWQLSGTGGPGSAITPSQQSAQPQESNGFSPTVAPIKINYDLIYLQSFGTRVFDLQYSFFTNVYAGTDISFQSNHLFEGKQIVQWGWSKEPFKVIWAARDDGKFLSLTFLKEQQVLGWTRHDTNGLVVSVAIASEPPVDATYFVVKRYVTGRQTWVYFTERMDNRLWLGPEDPWCLDCGLALIQPAPAATLTASAANGSGKLVAAKSYIIYGGTGYTNPTGQIIDPNGTGSGATIAFTVAGGVITGFSFPTVGTGYTAAICKIQDKTGSNATMFIAIDKSVVFTADSAVFGSTKVGDVLRMGGGIATITTLTSSTVVAGDILTPIISTIPNDPRNIPAPALPSAWTITTPVTTVTNLYHLEGMTVGIFADGGVLAPQVVTNATITLPLAASSIKIGLPFTAQLQSLHLEEPGKPTIQGKRKRISAITVRLEKSRGVTVGANQPAASALDFQKEVTWTNMATIPDRPNALQAGNAIPLFTGDHRVNISDTWNLDPSQAAPGFMAVQQTAPLPCNVLALICEFEVGDNS